MIFASFQGARKWPGRRQWLNKCVKCTGDRLGRCRRHSFGPSKPQAFPNFKDCISFDASQVRKLTGMSSSKVASRASTCTTVLWRVGRQSEDYMGPHSGRQWRPYLSLWEPQISDYFWTSYKFKPRRSQCYVTEREFYGTLYLSVCRILQHLNCLTEIHNCPQEFICQDLVTKH
jgi:hypothetical protein